MSEHSTTIAAGLTVMLLGAVPLLWLITTTDQPEPPPEPPIVLPEAPVDIGPTEVVITTPPPEIDGLSESVTRVLSAHGFAGTEDIADLPASVTRVLIEHGIALTVAEEG